MSLLGFNAIGRLALGQVQQAGQITTVMIASGGSLTITPKAATFAIFEAAGSYTLSISPVVASTEIFEVAGTGSLSLLPGSASFEIYAAVAPGSLTANGQGATFELWMPVSGGALVLTPISAPLWRTGFDYDVQQGGVGHYLLEMERAKQLARITRTIPPPVDRRTAPTFRPLASPPVAPIAPAVDMAAIQQQRMGEAAAKAKAAKKRRDEEAILLLAS